jgi:hypothetical protein
LDTQLIQLLNYFLIATQIISIIILFFHSKNYKYNPIPWLAAIILLPFIGLILFYFKLIKMAIGFKNNSP